MSVENTIQSYIVDEIMRGRDDGAALELDYPLIEERVLDSMDVQRLVAFIETRFEIRVPDEYLLPDNFASVRAIAKMVTELRQDPA
jgi:acyl carrier protein